MTNREKFIQVMNDTFNVGLTPENMIAPEINECSPCGTYKLGACGSYTCTGCYKWWGREWHDPKAKRMKK